MKEKNETGQKGTLTQFILKIAANETLTFVKISLGSASLIARSLDYHQKDSVIFPTIARNDSIFIVLKSVKQIQNALLEVKVLLESADKR